jgi:hypothetical protein
LRTLLILVIPAVAVVILATLPTEDQTEQPPAAYVSASRCKVCHLEIFNSWHKTKHAAALATLQGPQAEDSTCLSCHTTGFARGGYGASEVVVDLRGVQCEACHGAGSLYSQSSIMRDPKTSMGLGLVKPDSLSCLRCHNTKSPTFKGFAYQAGLLAGTHSRRRN